MSSTQVSSTPVQVAAPSDTLTTSIGRKVFMAITGFLLFGWLVGHMIGNLQIFLGQDKLNTYAETLTHLASIIWIVRVVMLTVIGIHIIFGIMLWWRNRASRPVKYVKEATVQATLASRTMIWTGLGLFLFIVYHLLHYTFIVTNPQYADLHDSLGRHDVYSMVVLGFQNYLISIVYIVAMFCLSYHLSHALASFLQTLGWNKTEVQPLIKKIAYTVATLMFLGFSSIPVAILLGIVTLPGGGH